MKYGLEYEADPRPEADMAHLHGVAWWDAPVPPPEHVCWIQTTGWSGLTIVQRCACGAVSFDGAGWIERNTR